MENNSEKNYESGYNLGRKNILRNFDIRGWEISAKGKSASATINTAGLYCCCTSGIYSGANFCKQYDLTDVNIIEATVFSNTGNGSIYVSEDYITNLDIVSSKPVFGAGLCEVSLDVSDKTGLYYVNIGMNYENGVTVLYDIRMY